MPNKVSELNTVHPTDCPVVLKVRTEYADWIYLIDNGYIRYYKSDKGKLLRKYEHQLVASEVLGESSKRLHVHHRNQNRLDNGVGNLELLNSSEHRKKHTGEKIFVDTTCNHCGVAMRIELKRFKKYNDHYCSQLCQKSHYRISSKPSKEKLLEAIERMQNWRKIGRFFNVSDNAARKWAKSYGIDPKAYNGARLHPYKKASSKTSTYKGVSKRKDRKNWYSHIYINGMQTHIGTYKTEVEAAKAYDKAALIHLGKDAYLNFPA